MIYHDSCSGLRELNIKDQPRQLLDISSRKPGLVLAGDLGCLLNIAGKLKRQGSAMAVHHVAELLAGEMDVPAIGDPQR